MKLFYRLLFSGIFFICGWADAFAGEKIYIGVDSLTNQSLADDEVLKSLKSRLEVTFDQNSQFIVVTDHAELENRSKSADSNSPVIGICGNILSVNMTTSQFTRNKRKYRRTFCTIELSLQLRDMHTGLIKNSKQVKSFSKPITETTAGTAITFRTRTTSVIRVRNLSSTEALAYYDALQKAVDQVFELLMEELYPLYVAAVNNNQVYINIPVPELIKKYSDDAIFEILQLGEEIIDPDTGHVMGILENRVMLVQLHSIDENLAITVPIEGEENLPLLEEQMKLYQNKLAQAGSEAEKAAITSPFQARPFQPSKADLKTRFQRR